MNEYLCVVFMGDGWKGIREKEGDVNSMKLT
jgi:hypothetical protein